MPELDQTKITDRPTARDGARTIAMPGTTLGRYHVIEELGRGGMGVVLRAYDPKLQREVALKCLRPGMVSAELQARMVAEGHAMAKIDHRNVVAIYDVEYAGDQALLAMELVRGTTLRRWFEASDRP